MAWQNSTAMGGNGGGPGGGTEGGNTGGQSQGTEYTLQGTDDHSLLYPECNRPPSGNLD